MSANLWRTGNDKMKEKKQINKQMSILWNAQRMVLKIHLDIHL